MEDLSNELYTLYCKIDHLNQEGVLFYPADIKTIEQVAKNLLEIVNDPLTRVYKAN